MNNIVYIFDWFLFIILVINVLYILIFSIASCFPKSIQPSPAILYKRIAIFIAAYREDAVIFDSVKACLLQNYPAEKYDVIVISDHMSPETNMELRKLSIKVLQVDFEKSTNTKSLKAALEYLDKDAYDIALVLDADNYIDPSYLSEINDAFANSAVKVLQTHRVAKNVNTNMAYLDAISEEINNSIFRLGHANLGFSAALIGSGMAFSYSLFYSSMMNNTSLGGFDRVLEMKLLYRRIFFYYLPDTYIYDEKIQKTKSFFLQRRRWQSAQYYSFIEFVWRFIPALKQRKWDFCDKLYQQASLSRLLLLGIVLIFSLLTSIWFPILACKWWIIFIILLAALAIAIPRKFWTFRMFKAVILVPLSFSLMFINLFYIKSANKSFIHTEHGTGNESKF